LSVYPLFVYLIVHCIFLDIKAGEIAISCLIEAVQITLYSRMNVVWKTVFASWVCFW